MQHRRYLAFLAVVCLILATSGLSSPIKEFYYALAYLLCLYEAEIVTFFTDKVDPPFRRAGSRLRDALIRTVRDSFSRRL